jgi:hypothetical protein
MVQFYALSVVANLLTGWLVGSEPGEGGGFPGQLRKLLEDNTLKFGLGLASLVIAVFKLLSPIEGDIPVVGDLLPAAAGLATGAILLLDFFAGSPALGNDTLNRLGSRLLGYRRYVGIGAAAAGLLHFLMPRVAVL